MKREFSKKDFLTQKAKEEGYPARSVYKLKEVDEKFKLLGKGFFVLDLGAAPGSWLLYIANKISMTGKLVGVDILDLNIKPPASNASGVASAGWLNNTIFIKKDVLAEDFFDSDFLKDKYNAVVSDMAPNTTGLLELDVANCLELTQRALEVAIKVLAKNGNFVCKIFEGPGTDDFVKETKKHFQMVKRYRPQAVRRGSKEFYLIAKGFSPQRKS